MRSRYSTILATMMIAAVLASAATAQTEEGALGDISNRHIDERQLREAVASRTLTWLTGSSANNDYISVGRTANFFGFVGLRVASGHSITRSSVAQDTLAVLTDAQRDALVALLDDQKTAFARTRDARFAMNRALEGMRVGDGISKLAFLRLGRAYGASEAELGRVVGQRLGDVAQTLSADQRAALSQIRAAHLSGRGDLVARPPARLRLSQADKQDLVNIAARFLSWTTGSQAFNDFEVVGKPSQHFGFVSLRLESNHGVRRGDVAKEVLALLSPAQREVLDRAAVHDARHFPEFLAVRGALMRALEVALSGGQIDAAETAELGAAVGEREASMTWSQATAMLDLRRTLTRAQSARLLEMRAEYTGAGARSASLDPVDRGRQIFAQCALCHLRGDGRSVGPELAGLVGRRIAADASFDSYSPALKAFAEARGVWSEAELDRFLQSPRDVVRGTVMGFDGLSEAQDRAAVIAYLKTL